jgi:hypothetical protein
MQLELFFEKEEYRHVSGQDTNDTYAYCYENDSERDWQIWCINKNYYGYLEPLYGEQFSMGVYEK